MRPFMKRVFIASASIVAILGIGQAQATNGVVSATHAGLFCYEFKLSGSPNWYAIPMIGTGYAMQDSDIASARIPERQSVLTLRVQTARILRPMVAGRSGSSCAESEQPGAAGAVGVRRSDHLSSP